MDLSPLLEKADNGKTPLSPDAQTDSLTVELDADGMPLTAGHVVAALAASATPLSPDESPEAMQQRTWDWLSEQPEDAAELAAILSEAAPRLRLSRDDSGSGYGSRSGSGRLQVKMSHSRDAVRSLRGRLAAAMPMPIGDGEIDWKGLTLVAGSEALFEEPAPAQPSPLGNGASSASCDLIEINSGGQVLFCFFAPAAPSSPSSTASSPLASGSPHTPQRSSNRRHTLASPFSSVQGRPTNSDVLPPGLPRTVSAAPSAAESPHALHRSATTVAESSPKNQGSPRLARELCVVVKFHGSRLTTQSEQFANELTRHLGLHAPSARILRKNGRTAGEWKEAYSAAVLLGRRGSTLEEQMGHDSCMLVMEYVPGRPLLRLEEPFTAKRACTTASELGRLFALDMLLGNADRMPCEALAWRGNLGNLMWARAGPHAHHTVAIDSLVQRRPPGGLVSVEDASCNKLTELMLNIEEVARQTLCEAVASSSKAAAGLQSTEASQAFQRALRQTLQDAAPVKGLCEMMFERLSEWIDAFISDMEEAEELDSSTSQPPVGSTSPSRTSEHAHRPSESGARANGGVSPGFRTPPWSSPSRRSSAGGTSPRGHTSPSPHSRAGVLSPQASFDATQRIRSITREARDNKRLRERLAFWKDTMRTRGVEMRSAMEEWQDRRFSEQDNAPSRLTTGFLDGNNPIVDIYELKVRLEHMLQRMRVLQSAAATAAPSQLLPHLYVSGAVPASAHHVLHHLGITHILNATDDLPEPPATSGFIFERVALRDQEDEPIAERFSHAHDFIEEARLGGGKVLLHCHEGISRSITLALAYLMRTQGWTMKEAMDFVVERRSAASPNAGFAAALSDLEEDLHGCRTVKVKSSKPEPRVCPHCDQVVGISTASLQIHLKRCTLDHD